MRRIVVFCVLLLVAGCATTQQGGMSADQLKAMAADKGLTGGCVTVVGVWGTARTTFISADKGVVINGNLSVDPNTCAVDFRNAPPPPRPAPIQQDAKP